LNPHQVLSCLKILHNAMDRSMNGAGELAGDVSQMLGIIH
jgi:hypothetical protein